MNATVLHLRAPKKVGDIAAISSSGGHMTAQGRVTEVHSDGRVTIDITPDKVTGFPN